MGLAQGGWGEEGERGSYLPAPGSAVRRLPAVPEMPRDGKGRRVKQDLGLNLPEFFSFVYTINITIGIN